MTAKQREEIRNMFGGKCAYCGKPLGKTFHVDHKTPMRRGMPGAKERDKNGVKYPSCLRCNTWKSTYSIEQFRQEIKAQTHRLRRDSGAFRLAEDFEMIRPNESAVVFHFERFGEGNKP